MQVIADAVAAKRNHFMSSLQFGAGASAPSAWSRSIADSSADMKLSPAPTVSTTSTRGAATSTRSLPSMASAPSSPERHDTKFWAGLRPGGKGVLDWASGIEPLEIFPACLDNMRERDLTFDEDCRRVAVRGHERPDIGIEADRRARARRRERGDDRLPVARVDCGDRADMQMASALRPFGRERPWAVESGRIEVERVARSRLGGAAHDEGERGRPRVARDEAKIDAVLGERRGERFAIPVSGNARDESRFRPEPGQADRHVIGRTAQYRVVGVGPDRIGDEVDERLAGNQDHRFGRPLARRPFRIMPACTPSSPSCRTPPHSVPVRAGRGSSLFGRRTARDNRRPPSAG